jgi:hypothetical protein
MTTQEAIDILRKLREDVGFDCFDCNGNRILSSVDYSKLSTVIKHLETIKPKQN